MILTHLVLFSFLGGAGGSAAPLNVTAANALAALVTEIVVQTPPRTVWINIEVILHPGSIWDAGSSVWDGGDDEYDNDGAIWDATSSFGNQTIPNANWSAVARPTSNWTVTYQ